MCWLREVSFLEFAVRGAWKAFELTCRYSLSSFAKLAAVMKYFLKWKRNRLVVNNPFVPSGECITTLGNPGPRTTTTHRCLFPRLLVHRTTPRCHFPRPLGHPQHQRPPCPSPCLHRLQRRTTPHHHQSHFRPLSTCSALHLNLRSLPYPISMASLPTLPSPPTSPYPILLARISPPTSRCPIPYPPTSPYPPTQSLSTAFPRRPSPSPIPLLGLRRWSAT